MITRTRVGLVVSFAAMIDPTPCGQPACARQSPLRLAMRLGVCGSIRLPVCCMI